MFGAYRDERTNYSTCVFPRAPFASDYDLENLLLQPRIGMWLLDLGCGSGDAAEDFASRHKVRETCASFRTVKAKPRGRKYDRK